MSLYEYKIKVIRVVDGDTVRADIDLGFGIWQHDQSLRLFGIDAPECRLHQPRGVGPKQVEHGSEAKDFLDKLIGPIVSGLTYPTQYPREFLMRSYKDTSGKYGRYLVSILTEEGEDVSQILSSNGFKKKDDYDEDPPYGPVKSQSNTV